MRQRQRRLSWLSCSALPFSGRRAFFNAYAQGNGAGATTVTIRVEADAGAQWAAGFVSASSPAVDNIQLTASRSGVRNAVLFTTATTAFVIPRGEVTADGALVITPHNDNRDNADETVAITARLSQATMGATSVTIAAQPLGLAAVSDFRQTGATLTIPAGQTSSSGAVTSSDAGWGGMANRARRRWHGSRICGRQTPNRAPANRRKRANSGSRCGMGGNDAAALLRDLAGMV